MCMDVFLHVCGCMDIFYMYVDAWMYFCMDVDAWMYFCMYVNAWIYFICMWMHGCILYVCGCMDVFLHVCGGLKLSGRVFLDQLNSLTQSLNPGLTTQKSHLVSLL